MADNVTAVHVIIGATGGIGSVLSRRLALEQGARLLVAGRDAQKLADLRHELVQQHPGDGEASIEAFPLEARDSAQVDQCFQRALERFGRVDGAANLAGSILIKPAHLVSDEEWHDTLGQNLHTAFFVLRAAVKAMMQHSEGGSIVLMSSVAGKFGLPNHEAIAAAKAGVQGLVISAASTYANRQIRVNGLAPGLVDTPLSSRLTSNEVTLKASKAMHPLGRVGSPQDIAPVIEWLLTPGSSWVTGQVLSIDGGMSTVKAK